ncbi:MAG: selenoneine biosynthesis selenosugar synthase SenB [Candidatus Zixiibacteriota bacterium]
MPSQRLKILLVTPAPASSRYGNRVTAVRWSRILRALGHRVEIRQEYAGQRCDLLLALHAHRSAPSVERFGQAFPERPVIVALTGTDVYDRIHSSRRARRCLESATALVTLQKEAINELPAHLRGKAHVIHQSATASGRKIQPLRSVFEVSFLSHLRAVKDPLLPARATRLLPTSSLIRITHVGEALDRSLGDRAREETQRNSRYMWIGQTPHWRAKMTLRRSRLMVITSRLEGGANVVSEALAASTPVISTRISGSIGMLGENYPGYFPVGDQRALADMFNRVENDGRFYKSLQTKCKARRALFSPEREKAAWRKLLKQLPR